MNALIPCSTSGIGKAASEEESEVLFLRDNALGLLAGIGRDDDLGEDIADGLGHLLGDHAVRGDHATERGDRIGGMRLAIGLGDVEPDGDAEGGLRDAREARLCLCH
mgnify:CR=1 FL=1